MYIIFDKAIIFIINISIKLEVFMKCVSVQIKGIVQGVGFRPFVYTLALKYDIKGWVNNDEKGVNIFLYATQENIKLFFR